MIADEKRPDQPYCQSCGRGSRDVAENGHAGDCAFADAKPVTVPQAVLDALDKPHVESVVLPDAPRTYSAIKGKPVIAVRAHDTIGRRVTNFAELNVSVGIDGVQFAEQIAAALTGASWQPISTAPKDGSRILALTVHDELEIMLWYRVETDSYVDAGGGLFRQQKEVFSEGWNGHTPKWWMPLPPVPERSDDMSEYAKELVREAVGFGRCGYVDVKAYGRLVSLVDGLLGLESEANEKLEAVEVQPPNDICVCGHSSAAHGNDGTGPCGGTQACRAGACQQFRSRRE